MVIKNIFIGLHERKRNEFFHIKCANTNDD